MLWNTVNQLMRVTSLNARELTPAFRRGCRLFLRNMCLRDKITSSMDGKHVANSVVSERGSQQG